jgi:hypothetical protein
VNLPLTKRPSPFFLLVGAVLCLSACSYRSPLEGAWKGDGRTLVFHGKSFTIEYDGQTRVRAIRGGFGMKGKTATLVFEEYRENAATWMPLEGTDLDGRVETMEIAIDGSRLKTVILSSGKTYEYEKIESE